MVHERVGVAFEEIVDLIELFFCYPHVRAREPAEIKDPVEHRHRFRTELPVDVLFLNDHRVLRFIKAERKIGFAEPVDGRKDRVCMRPLVGKARVPFGMAGGGKHRRPLVPCPFEILMCLPLPVLRIELHTTRSRQTTLLSRFSSLIL